MKGFEPLKAEPESAVLPLHYIPTHQILVEDTQTEYFCQGLGQTWVKNRKTEPSLTVIVDEGLNFVSGK
jgi:hypothetical protein